jgi:hypothetical protein
LFFAAFARLRVSTSFFVVSVRRRIVPSLRVAVSPRHRVVFTSSLILHPSSFASALRLSGVLIYNRLVPLEVKRSAGFLARARVGVWF